MEPVDAPAHTPSGYFKYKNSLEREYSTEPANISSVTFRISRYDEFHQTINFPNLVCERDAIAAAEEYLSEPLTEDYYEIIRDDTYMGGSWNEAKENFETRGDCLGDAIFIEDVDIEDGSMTFTTGS
eukprot:TRINITY_DN4332_c0_g1_i1.p1 TRINITY_DN4332_c0_g1~~TRINITY_DN4332_c0_g1_i1.p1  ORF type:complete len:127 (-),score=1.35 TRINITY_DN4332_c0_g1_i1:66-446(-)